MHSQWSARCDCEKMVFGVRSFQIIVLLVVLFNLSHQEVFFSIRKCFNNVLKVRKVYISLTPPIKTALISCILSLEKILETHDSTLG